MASNQQMQKVDLYQPMLATRNNPPLTLRVGVPNPVSISEGVPASGVKIETYVLWSALPKGLQQQVEVALQALIAGR